MKEKKIVKVDFSNKCGRMKLKINSEDAIDQSLKIMKIFDDACNLDSEGEGHD